MTPVRKQQANSIISIWEDLRRRNVYRVGVGYVAIAWLAVEMTETIGAPLGWPEWSVTLAIVLALIGLPIALILGWFFEITPDGVVVDPPRGVTWRGYLVIDSLIFAVLALAGSIYWFRIHELNITEPHAGEFSIAVMPFANIGKDSSDDAFSIGLADELLTVLTRVKELHVSSRIATEYFKNSSLPLPEIAAALKVHYLVEGSVQREAGRIRVTVQLIDADTNRHLWADNYEKAIRGLIDLRAQMAVDILDGLGLALPIKSIEEIKATPTGNGEAYVYYLQGKEYLRRPRIPANLAEAESLFDNAIEADPRFAGAHAGLCMTHLASFAMDKDTERFERAEIACHRAITLDDRQVDVYVALGELYRLSSQQEKAIEFFDLALRKDSRAVDAMMNKGLALDGLDRQTDAETALREAIKLEQYYWRSHNSLGRFLMRHTRYQGAVEEFQAATVLNPDNNTAFNNLAAALYMIGDMPGAIAAFDRSIEIEPSRTVLMNTANLHYYRGEFDQAAKRYEQAWAMALMDDRPLGGVAASVRFVPARQAESVELFNRASSLAEEVLKITPDDRLAWARLASYRAYAGKREAALEALERSGIDQTDNTEVLFFGCLAYIALGQKQKAIDVLETLVQMGYTRDILMNDPDLAPIRDDVRIVAALSGTRNTVP